MIEAKCPICEKPATPEHFKLAAEAALKGAKTHPENAFKAELARRGVVRALKLATA